MVSEGSILASSLHARHLVDYFDIDLVGGSSPTLRLDEEFVPKKTGGFTKNPAGDGSKEISPVMVVDGGNHICSEENTFIVLLLFGFAPLEGENIYPNLLGF